MTIPSISVIIPLYYNSPTLYRPISNCLKSLKYQNQPIQLFLIDDCSPLEHDFVDHFWMNTWRSPRNKGFTATVNIGLAFSRHYPVMVVMNDDIVMTEECLKRFSKLKGLQIASPADTASSPNDRFGACWGMTREVYDLLGPLNEKYKHFYSDLDYYNRAKAAGVEIIKWDDIVLDHPESSTYKTLDKEKLLEEDRKRFEEV